MVLGGGADERDAADVDFLNDVLERGSGSHGVLERIEVDYYQVDALDAVLGHLAAVAFVVAAGEDAAEHLRVQRLYAAAEYRGIARDFFDCLAGVTEIFDECTRAAGGEEPDAEAVQLLDYGCQTFLIVNRYQCGLYLFEIRHLLALGVYVCTIRVQIYELFSVFTAPRPHKFREIAKILPHLSPISFSSIL